MIKYFPLGKVGRRHAPSLQCYHTRQRAASQRGNLLENRRICKMLILISQCRLFIEVKEGGSMYQCQKPVNSYIIRFV